MNKQEAISKIMKIKAVLPERFQAELIEAVKVLATFKMISVDDDMPYNHPRLPTKWSRCLIGSLCLVRTQNGDFHLDKMAADFNGIWSWVANFKEMDGDITHWLYLKALMGPRIMDEFGNELKIE